MAIPVVNPFETFKQGQEAVLAATELIRPLTRNYPAAKAHLPELEARLFAHLQFQQDKIYPALETFFSADRAAMKKIEFLRYDLREMKFRLLDFYERHPLYPHVVAIRNFPLEFAALRQAVIDRINAEEDHLLPLLELYLRSQETRT